MSLSTRKLRLLVLGIGLLMPATTFAKPKVGSPAWKRQFKQRQAESKKKFEAQRKAQNKALNINNVEFDRKLEAKRRQMDREKRERDARHYRVQHASDSFDASKAPTPVACLKSFRKAAANATSFKQLLPYKSAIQRDNYRISQLSESDWDHLKFTQDLLGGIVRIDNVRIDGHFAYINVVIKVREDGYCYNEGTFTMKGEGNRWRMDQYKTKLMWKGMPPVTK